MGRASKKYKFDKKIKPVKALRVFCGDKAVKLPCKIAIGLIADTLENA